MMQLGGIIYYAMNLQYLKTSFFMNYIINIFSKITGLTSNSQIYVAVLGRFFAS